MPDMFWGNYRLMLETRREARIVTFPFFDDGGSFNTVAFRAACEKHRSAGKLMVLLNFPNNPAGYAPTVEEADAIVAALHDLAEEGLDIIVVTDDAYFGLYYRDDVYGESLFSRCANLHERVLACKVDGATKEEYLWGLRLGFLTIAAKGLTPVHYDAFEKKLTGSIRASVSNGNTLGQSVLLRMLEDPAWQQEKEQIYADMRRRFETVQDIIASYEGPLVALPCNAGYFMSFDCGELDAERIRVYLLERGIGTIAIQNKYLRVAFASVDAGDLPSLYKEIFDAAHAISKEQTQ
jgi:aspartate/methionine/tyrosine aminotransferase